MTVDPPRVLVDMTSPYPFWSFQDRHRRVLRERFPDVEIAVGDSGVNADDHEVFFGWQCPPHKLSAMSKLKWVASPSAGCDHLPLREAAERGITVTRAYGYHGPPMAAHAIGLLLGFSRGLFLSHQRQATAEWWKDEMASVVTDLDGEVITIVGCGHVGHDVAKLARAHGLRVQGIRRHPPTGESDIDWVPAADVGAALDRSLCVVNLLPATAATHRYFDRARFGAMRRGAIFLNLGRASTVDHEALLDALDSGQVGWCGLDVHDPKPPRLDSPLRHHPRVVLTPKSSVFSHRYVDDAVDFFATNLARFIAGQDLLGHLVGPRRHS